MKCIRDSGCYDLCSNCLYNGATCLVSQEHSLYVFLTGFNLPRNESAYTKTHGCGIVKCNHCSKDSRRSLYFHTSPPVFSLVKFPPQLTRRPRRLRVSGQLMPDWVWIL